MNIGEHGLYSKNFLNHSDGMDGVRAEIVSFVNQGPGRSSPLADHVSGGPELAAAGAVVVDARKVTAFVVWSANGHRRPVSGRSR